MVLSLAFLTLQDCGPLETIRAAAAAGFQRVGLRLLPATPEEPDYPLLRDDRLLREVMALLADTGLTVGDVELVRLGPFTVLDSVEPLLERAGRLGAEHLVVVNDDPEPNRFVDRFSELCGRAGPYGLTVDLEPMTWTATPDLATASCALARVSESNAGILVDALHFHRGRSRIEEFEALASERVHLFQLCDAPRRFSPDAESLKRVSRGERLLPGDGELDLLPLLRRCPPHITISVEVPNLADMRVYTPTQRALRARQASEQLLSRMNHHASEPPSRPGAVVTRP